MEEAFKLYESLLEHDYFAGEFFRNLSRRSRPLLVILLGKEPGYADFMSWPWVERLGAVEILSEGRIAVTKDKYPKFAAYIERMKNIPEIKTFLLDGQTHFKFINGFITGKTSYDDIL